mgnify:FL=1
MLVLNDISQALAKSDTPIIEHIYCKDGKKLSAIGLRSGAEFLDFIPSLQGKIMVVQGEIDFNTCTNSYRLECFDSFDIPEGKIQSIVGVFDAIFILLMEEKNKLEIA